MLFHAIRVSGRRAALIVAALVLATAAPVAAKHYEAWGTAVLETINTAAGEGCPIESPDGRSLFIASNRPGASRPGPSADKKLDPSDNRYYTLNKDSLAESSCCCRST